MRKLCILAIVVFVASPLAAQQFCPGHSVIVNTPEDKLMLTVNGATDPQQQVDALNQFIQANPASNFLPCAYESLTMAYLKQNNFAKVIEAGQKALAIPYQDALLLVNLEKGYVGAGEANDDAFAVIDRAPAQVKAETPNSRPANASDAEWQSTLSDYQSVANNVLAYMDYAFFQLLPRVTDASKRIQYLDAFQKAYPNDKNVSAINFQYLIAYRMANNTAMADSYGEKAIQANPDDMDSLSMLAYDYAIGRTNPTKAAVYAKKVIALAPGLKKPEGATDTQFQEYQNGKLGLAHMVLGYVDFLETQRTHREGSAIQEFETAAKLLNAMPPFQAQALFYLGNAYEFSFPPNHRAAIAALTQAAKMQTPWRPQAEALLAKVKAASR